jgi:hypothetical protein
MKHMKRFTLVLALVALLVMAPLSTVLAQGDGGNPLCNGLAEADCQILSGVSGAMEGVRSFSAPSWAINLAFDAGTSGAGSFTASGSGEFMFPEDMTDPALTGLLIHLTLPEVVLTTAQGTQNFAGEVIVQGDMAYVNFNGEWYGGQLTEEDLQSLRDTFSGATGGQTTFDPAAMGFDLSGIVTTTRGADSDQGAVFTTNVDIAGLVMAILSSPAFGQLLGGADMGMTEMTPEDLQLLGGMFAPMLQGTTIVFEQTINPDNNLLTALKLDVNLALDMSMLDPTIGAITGAFQFSADLDEAGGTFEVTPPTEFRPLEELEAQLDALTSQLEGSM